MKKTTTYIILLVISCLFCQCEDDTVHRTTIYFKENVSKIEKLRNWDIYFESERDFWSCRHWYSKDSLLTVVLIRVDKYNNVISYDIGSSHEDSVSMVQMASQNVITLHEIRKLCRSESIGTHEVELFNDTLTYDYVINVGKEKSRYQIIRMKHGNNTIGNHLYGKWYMRKE